MNVILPSVVFCAFFGNALSPEWIDFDCVLGERQVGDVGLRCSMISSASELILTEDFLGRINATNDTTNERHMLSEYQRPIADLSLSLKDTPLTIEKNALRVFPDLSSMWINSYPGPVHVAIPVDEFKNTPRLKELYLHYVNVTSDVLSSVRSARGLESFFIHRGRVDKLKANTFLGMKNLTRLSFDDCGPVTIENGAFDGLEKVDSITFISANISSLVEALPKDSSKLRAVNLENNAVRSIRKTDFSKYKALREINLHKNPITKIESGAFDKLEDLSVLYLIDCPINSLPEDLFQDTTNLSKLWLKNTSIEQISRNLLKGLTNLQVLNLHTCRELKRIEARAFDDLVDLRNFQLTATKLKTLPPGLFANMTKLEYVDIWGNCVDNLSKRNFTHCPNLREYKVEVCT